MKKIIIVAGLIILQGVQGSAAIIKCKSWNTFTEKVALVANVNGNAAQVIANINGRQVTFSAKASPWHNLPNRCANSASGLVFSGMPASIPYFHIVTQSDGTGCEDPSAISVGSSNPEIYLTCSINGKILP